MSPRYDQISANTLCEIIQLLSPTVDDYLYVYDFGKDYYYISPHAKDRFLLPEYAFHDVAQNLQKVVYPEDFPKLREDLNGILTTNRCTHDLTHK